MSSVLATVNAVDNSGVDFPSPPTSGRENGSDGGKTNTYRPPAVQQQHMEGAACHTPRSILVTGGCGFIGSNFINYIYDRWPQAKLINLDKLAEGRHTIENVESHLRRGGANPSSRYTFVEGDLIDGALVQRLLREHSVDTVIHFAAITHVDESYANRVGTIHDNVIATTHLLEAVNVVNSGGGGGVERLIHISTDEVYGDSREGDGGPKTETSLPNPTNPYAASKAACELVVRSYHHSFRLPYVMVRMNNVYGPRQAYSKLIPKFTRLALDSGAYPLMGDGMHARSWMYVDDCAEAIRLVTERGRLGEIYNIGTEFEMANLHLTQQIHERVAKLLGRDPVPEIRFAPIADRPYHDRRYNIDFSKIRVELGWECAVPFGEGLERTLNYYLKDYGEKKRQDAMADRPQG